MNLRAHILLQILVLVVTFALLAMTGCGAAPQRPTPPPLHNVEPTGVYVKTPCEAQTARFEGDAVYLDC